MVVKTTYTRGRPGGLPPTEPNGSFVRARLNGMSPPICREPTIHPGNHTFAPDEHKSVPGRCPHLTGGFCPDYFILFLLDMDKPVKYIHFNIFQGGGRIYIRQMKL